VVVRRRIARENIQSDLEMLNKVSCDFLAK